jgi:hypothetical protein
LVDLLGHDQLGGQTLLYLIDGLYSCVHPEDWVPRRWDFPPFSGDWTSSLFASQDPLAIESVCFDFMQEEGDPRQYPQMPGVDDYLHEAALADNPPSGTFYDPDHEGDIQRLSSLGVHEHWNNSTDKRYSRNLGTGNGIELLMRGPSTTAADPPIGTVPGTFRDLTLTTYPNPATPRTTIRYDLPQSAPVKLMIRDVAGRLIRVLVNEPMQQVGRHNVLWDGKDDAGRQVSAGVYFCKLEAGSRTCAHRMVVLN